MNRTVTSRTRIALTLIATTLSLVALLHATDSSAQIAGSALDPAARALTLSDASGGGQPDDGGSADPGSGGSGHTNGRSSGGALCVSPPTLQYSQCVSQCGELGVAAFDPGTCGMPATCTCGPSNPLAAAATSGAATPAVALPRPADPFAGVVDAGGVAQF